MPGDVDTLASEGLDYGEYGIGEQGLLIKGLGKDSF